MKALAHGSKATRGCHSRRDMHVYLDIRNLCGCRHCLSRNLRRVKDYLTPMVHAQIVE